MMEKANAQISISTAPRQFYGGSIPHSISTVSDLGNLVRNCRRNMKLSQLDFADLAGVGRRFVSELESGKSTLEIERVLRVCKAAGIDLTAYVR
jgi:y4mF family transcriptional regulator